MTQTPINVRRGVIALAVATVVTAISIWSDKETWTATKEMTLWLWTLFITVNGSYILLLVLTLYRRNWARWAVVVWCVLGWVALTISFFLESAPLINRIVEAVTIALEVWGCQQLLSRSASSWFRVARVA